MLSPKLVFSSLDPLAVRDSCYGSTQCNNASS